MKRTDRRRRCDRCEADERLALADWPCTCSAMRRGSACPTCRAWHRLLSRREALTQTAPSREPTIDELLEQLHRRYELDPPGTGGKP